MSLHDLSPENIESVSDEELRQILSSAVRFQQDDVRENQLLYYRPVSQEAEKFHACEANTIAIFGGNGSSKSETSLVDLVISATGIVPESLKGKIHPSKLRGPVACRVVLRSLSNMLHQTMLKKLQWWQWDGESAPGGPRGHWGWIPRTSLINGRWEDSWSEKSRLLRLHYRDPENPEMILGESTIQFMSSDQDAIDMAASSLHVVMVDEITPLAVWLENKARVMRGNGRITLSMTFPDDASIPCEWIFDELYDKGQPGPNHDPNVAIFEFHTTDNPHLNQDRVRQDMKGMSEALKKVRIFGQSMRFSNRIHPLFTNVPTGWCFKCGEERMLENERCSTCGAEDVTTYVHVKSFDHHYSWPVIFALDPHPRKPHMLAWFAVDTYDDIWQVAEAQVDGDCVEVAKRVQQVERELHLNIAARIMDPNMGASPSGQKRGVTWQSEFRDAGLQCDLADDSDVGRSRFNEYLKPDPRRLQPRAHIHERCHLTIHQLKRFVWDEFKTSAEKDLKQRPKPKHDDYPALWRYTLNTNPSFVALTRGAAPMRW